MKKLIITSSVALAAAFISPVYAQTPPNVNATWGFQIKSCIDNTACYNGGTRGSYVSQQANPATDPTGSPLFGYAEELFTLGSGIPANPPLGGPN